MSKGKLTRVPQAESKDIVLGHYRLTKNDVVITGLPSIEEHEQVGEVIKGFYKQSPIWLAKWLRYGEQRPDWKKNPRLKQRLEEAAAVAGVTEKRMKNIRAVGALPPELMRDDVEFSILEVVVGQPAEDRAELLDLAATEGLAVSELRREIQSRRRRKVLEGTAIPEGQYRVWYVDFPWDYGDSHPSGRSARSSFPTMSYEKGREFMANLVNAHCTKEAFMGFWVPAPLVYDVDPVSGKVGPHSIIEACGFTPKNHRIWDKVDHVYGHYFSVRHEVLFYCTKGSCLPDHALRPQLDSVVIERERESDEHSSKPKCFRDDIAKQYEGPRVEIFARSASDGWTVFGNDARLFPAA